MIKARLGEPLTLDCTYNCSSGFIRGSWKFEKTQECGTCLWFEREKNISEDMCIVSFKTINLTLEQIQYNYSCYSIKTDYQGMPSMLERLVSLQIQGRTLYADLHVLFVCIWCLFMIMFVVDTTSGPVIPRKVALGKSRKMNCSCHEDSQHYPSYSSLLSSVSDAGIEVEIYHNQRKLNLSSYSIQVPVGDKLNLECLSTNNLCESQWMRDDANLTDDISGPLIEWNEITEDDEGTYTCHTKQLCTSQRISVVVDVIKKGKLLSF